MRYLILLPLILLGACASPDVGVFKQSTSAFTSGLMDGQLALVADAETVAAKMPDPDRLKPRIAGLKKDEKLVKEAAAALAAYATSVANLANSGEDGADAAQSMLNNVSSAVGSVSGTTPQLPGILEPITTALGQIVQQNQNKKLHEIMKLVQDDVNAFATKLGDLHTSEDGIIDALASYWADTRDDLNQYHVAYDKLKGQLVPTQAIAAANISYEVTSCMNRPPCDYAKLSADHKTAQVQANTKLSELQTLKNELQPYEDSYQAHQQEIATWTTKAKARIRAIPDLAQAWKNDHAAIIAYLETCTNASGIFNSKCGAFSAGNLELFGALLGKAAFPL
jgi:hypothetical protein